MEWLRKLKNQKWDEILFYIGLALLPFDNLFFAPSRGWATIAPIVFFVYVLWNVKYVLNGSVLPKKEQLLVLLILVLSVFGYIFHQPTISTTLDAAQTLILGFSFYFAVQIYFIQKKGDGAKALRLLFTVYTIAFFYGVLYCMKIPFVERVMEIIEKRHYGRLQYTFTEPSFISMHLFGVLLPCATIFKEHKKESRALLMLIGFYLLLSFVFGGSTRLYLDALIVAVIVIGCRFFRGKFTKKKAVILAAAGAALVVAVIGLSFVERIRNIMKMGVYGDASLASRFFRINALFKGFIANPVGFLFGYGLGNTFYPFHLGYDAALLEYRNAYATEVLSLKGVVTTSFFCGHFRVIADFGLIVYLLFLWYLLKGVKNKLPFFLIMTYLYVQFDSFAFYTVWLYLFYMRYESAKDTRCALKKAASRFDPAPPAVKIKNRFLEEILLFVREAAKE